MTEVMLNSVDRSWSRYTGNSEGEFARSDTRKLHIDRGDSTAKCSRAVLLNTDVELPWALSEADEDRICRRCVPRTVSTERESLDG